VQLDLYTQIIFSVLSVYQSAEKSIYIYYRIDTSPPLLPLLREVNPFYTIQRPFVMLHFNNIIPSTHLSFRWFHQWLQRILKSASCVPFHNCFTFIVPRLPPNTKQHNHRLSVFRSCLSHASLSAVGHICTSSSHSGPQHRALVNRGPLNAELP
jgi:hypothetical protein